MPTAETPPANPAIQRLIGLFPVGCRVKNIHTNSQYLSREGRVMGHFMDDTTRIPRGRVQVKWDGETEAFSYRHTSLQLVPVRLADLTPDRSSSTRDGVVIEQWKVVVPAC